MSAAAVGCVFRAPPPLPEELAQAEPPIGAAAAAPEETTTAGAEATPAPTQPEAEGEPAAEYAAGDPPELGMTPTQMQAYATAQGDPQGGDFTLEEATAGLEGGGELWIDVHTTSGLLQCRLFEDQTPLTVANFVGLARGLRPAKDPESGAWTTRPYYDDTEFHRVIEGFMIQGGDPTGTGMGGTGYVIPDEFVPELRHDRAGRLSMANRGPGTGSSQFFVTLGPTSHLDDKHTVFGQCTDASIAVAESIAETRGPEDRPVTPQKIEKIDVVRREPAQ